MISFPTTPTWYMYYKFILCCVATYDAVFVQYLNGDLTACEKTVVPLYSVDEMTSYQSTLTW